jgi:flagellar biosynthesis/type III secretory pathway ATPase
VKGSNSKVDEALKRLDRVQGFLRQAREQNAPWKETLQQLKSLLE